MRASPFPEPHPIVTRLPYPEFGAAGIQFLKADGVGNYNGLSAKLSQRFGTNLTTLFSYTWSKALDDGSAIRGAHRLHRAGLALPGVRLRHLHFQCSASFRGVGSLHACRSARDSAS